MRISFLLMPAWRREGPTPTQSIKTWHCILYAFAGGIFSATLFYSQPMLLVLSQDFGTTQAQAANVPTLALAGDATGLLFVLPLADSLPRRGFTLTMLFMCTVFCAIFSSIIQILLVLVSELSDPRKRAFNLSIVAAGPTTGILMARVLAGLIVEYRSWRYVYVLGLCLQVVMFVLLFLLMPNSPTADEKSFSILVRSYPRRIVSIFTLYFKHPVLVQASFLSACTFFVVASFWTTLTFFLSAEPYNYSTIGIGLFGLIGISTMIFGPVYAKFIITPIDIPLVSAATGILVSMVGTAIGMALGSKTIAGPVMQALFLDAGLTILQISNRIAITDLEPLRRNQINTAFVIVFYLGMVCGTKAGNALFEQGGWLYSEGLNIAVLGFSMVLLLLRGPNEVQWVGWQGGWTKQKEVSGQAMAA